MFRGYGCDRQRVRVPDPEQHDLGYTSCRRLRCGAGEDMLHRDCRMRRRRSRGQWLGLRDTYDDGPRWIFTLVLHRSDADDPDGRSTGLGWSGLLCQEPPVVTVDHDFESLELQIPGSA